MRPGVLFLVLVLVLVLFLVLVLVLVLVLRFLVFRDNADRSTPDRSG